MFYVLSFAFLIQFELQCNLVVSAFTFIVYDCQQPTALLSTAVHVFTLHTWEIQRLRFLCLHLSIFHLHWQSGRSRCGLELYLMECAASVYVFSNQPREPAEAGGRDCGATNLYCPELFGVFLNLTSQELNNYQAFYEACCVPPVPRHIEGRCGNCICVSGSYFSHFSKSSIFSVHTHKHAEK